jgi:hypothetical protein
MSNPAWEKGKSANPNGRPKGRVNNSTEKIKEAYTDLIEGNLDNIQNWLNRTAATDPARALDFLIKLSPFVIPKKQQADITFENPINIVLPKKPSENSEED